MNMQQSVVSILVIAVVVASANAQDAKEFVPDRGKFAPATKSQYLAGELVYIDPVNRRGGIRLHGDDKGRYWSGPPHYFALLPYATVWFNGSLAELRDVPLGTHVHGYFFRPPKGEEDTIPPLPAKQKQFTIPHNHAVTLEDDFSFYQRRGQAWKVVSIDLEKEKINVEPIVQQPKRERGRASVTGNESKSRASAADVSQPILGAGDSGRFVKDGINTPYTFDIDTRTRIWKDRRLSDLEELKPGTTVQLNLAWAQGWGQREFRVGEIWLDRVSRDFATEMQRRRHIRYERQRWTPGWIDHVEPFDFGGGIVTLTLFEVDQELIDDLRRDKNERIAVAVAEKTRRTWIHRSDRKFAKLVEWKEIKAPPLGNSGVQLRLKFVELLSGYKPGGCVRVKAENWKWVSVPPEERITSREEQEQGAKMVLPF